MNDPSPYPKLAELAARLRLATSRSDMIRLDGELFELDERIRAQRKRLYAAQVEVEHLRRQNQRALIGATINAIAGS